MKRYMVYPFDESFLTVLEHADLLKDVEIGPLISKSGWGLVNNTYSYGKKEYHVMDSFSESLKDCDGVWFRESFFPIDLKGDLEEKVRLAVQQNKTIIYTRESEDNIVTELRNSGLLCQPPRQKKEIDDEKHEHIFSIEKPVLFVTGIMEQMDKFDTQLCVYDEFIRSGYKVTWLSSRKEGEMLGAYPIPQYMKENSMPPREKILRFNNYVMELEGEEHPDLFLIGIPGEVTPFSARLVFDFGITMFEICQAMRPDYVILNTVLGEYNEECADSMRKAIEVKYNIEIDSLNILPYLLNDEVIERNKVVSYVTVSDESVEPKVMNIGNDNLYYLRDRKEVKRLVGNIIDKLNEYSNVIQL